MIYKTKEDLIEAMKEQSGKCGVKFGGTLLYRGIEINDFSKEELLLVIESILLSDLGNKEECT